MKSLIAAEGSFGRISFFMRRRKVVFLLLLLAALVAGGRAWQVYVPKYRTRHLIAELRGPDKDSWVHEAFLWACRNLGITPPEERPRRFAEDIVWEIAKIGEPAVPILVDELKNREDTPLNLKGYVLGLGYPFSFHISDALVEIGPPSVPYLVKALESDDPFWRGQAVGILYYMGKDAAPAVPALTRALKDPNENTRFCAIWALEWLGPTAVDALPQLRDLMKNDPDKDVRWLAAETLGKIGTANEETLSDLAATIDSGSPQVRISAAGALLALGEADRTIPMLFEALQSDDWEVCGTAVGVLSRDGPYRKQIIDGLVSSIGDGSALNVKGALLAAQFIGREAHETTPGILGALSSSDEDIRGAALRALVAIAPPDEKAVDMLLDLLGGTAIDGSSERYDVVEALGAIGPAARLAVPTLIEILEKNKDVGLRREAARALGRIGPDARAAIPQLEKAMKDEDVPLRLAAMIAQAQIEGRLDDTVSELIRMLGDKDQALREAAVEALGGIDPLPDAAETEIRKLRDDDNSRVRNATRNILYRIENEP